jgi:hypothetical protein
MKNIHLWLFLVITVVMAGCQTIGDNAPAAQTPSGVTVSAILTRGGSWTTVGPHSFNPNTYKILPGGLPSGGFQLYFYAPYPALLQVTIDGVKLPKFEDIPAGTDPAVTGFYRIGNINPNLSTPYWNIGVRPPSSQLTSLHYVVGVSSVSINPKFRDAAGNNQLSSPLNLVMISQDVNRVALLFPGAGHGTISVHAEGDVNSTPMDTSCSAECSIDFGTLYDITLKAHPSGSSTFTQWSGDCSGTGTTCGLHLNGQAKAVAATFSRGSGGGAAQNCPALSPPAGYSYFGMPLCDSQNVFNDPAPDLACDAQSYYCCAINNGTNDPRCGNDHKSFPASCIGYGNPKVRMEPSGCYIQN